MLYAIVMYVCIEANGLDNCHVNLFFLNKY